MDDIDGTIHLIFLLYVRICLCFDMRVFSRGGGEFRVFCALQRTFPFAIENIPNPQQASFTWHILEWAAPRDTWAFDTN